jgi:hypothetical protein
MLKLLALFEARFGSCSLSPGRTSVSDLCALGLPQVHKLGYTSAIENWFSWRSAFYVHMQEK